MMFEVFHNETTPVEVTVTGHIPEYACGVLYRTGPGGYRIPTDKGNSVAYDHWFDAFAQTHRFNIVSPTKVIYNSRHTCDALINQIQKTGSIPEGFSFAQKRDPCQSLFRKFLSIFHPPGKNGSTCGMNSGNPASVIVGVTVSTDLPGLDPTTNDGTGRNLYTKTDGNILQGLDPETLEPVGLARQTAFHPDLKGSITSSHSQQDQDSGDVFNYNLELGRTCVYRVFKTSKESGRTEILATITDAPPAYIHSFFLTKNYVILCIFSAHFAMGGIKILYHKNMLDALEDVAPERNARWYVVDRRHGRGVVRRYESEPFFAFHTSNAWEENGGVVAEISTFENIDIIKKFYMHNLLGEGMEAKQWLGRGRPRFSRFWLRDVEMGKEEEVGWVEKVWEQEHDVSLELPTVNPRYYTRSNRFTYGLLNRGKSSLLDAIIKFDSVKAEHKIWEQHAHTPGEAIFVPDPEAEEGDKEDAGVLLSVVLNGITGVSYLLVLDAESMKEVARAEMKKALPFGFHGAFVKDWVGEA
ncbi:putative dioxygenase [Wilcoxina mikolae CBS 423.85]|nr:putative dioxygenase [Wilcoxina mikolae CBS 423.85]